MLNYSINNLENADCFQTLNAFSLWVEPTGSAHHDSGYQNGGAPTEDIFNLKL